MPIARRDRACRACVANVCRQCGPGVTCPAGNTCQMNTCVPVPEAGPPEAGRDGTGGHRASTSRGTLLPMSRWTLRPTCLARAGRRRAAQTPRSIPVRTDQNLVARDSQANHALRAPNLRLTREPIRRRIAEQREQLGLRPLARLEQLRPFVHLDSARAASRRAARKRHRCLHPIANVDEPVAFRDLDAAIGPKRLPSKWTVGMAIFSLVRGLRSRQTIACSRRGLWSNARAVGP